MANLLRHIGERKAGAVLRKSILEAIGEGKGTRDVGGQLSTTDFTAEVAQRVQAGLA
jgi:isocitrate/isopropylmalate dehydrogenase